MLDAGSWIEGVRGQGSKGKFGKFSILNSQFSILNFVTPRETGGFVSFEF